MGFRIFAIPHFIVLAFLMTAWWLVTVLSWLLILVSGRYPKGLYDFSVGCFQWYVRVEAYRAADGRRVPAVRPDIAGTFVIFVPSWMRWPSLPVLSIVKADVCHENSKTRKGILLF